MKRILTVYTGGTICCEAGGKMRDLNPELAKRALISNFANGTSVYASLSAELFEDSEFENQTLSENMTLEKLSVIINHIKSFELNNYCGIIVMHGTDTLAFTASLFSFVFSELDVPLIIVSGNRPPEDALSNANENFKTAVELIMNRITPNVYVPYRNSDGKMYVHLGTNIMQCGNFTDDFYGADADKSMEVHGSLENALDNCLAFSKKGVYFDFDKIKGSVLYVTPYTGLDYAKIDLSGIDAVVHGSYHCGTVCVESDAENTRYSFLWFANECEKQGIPVFVAPSKLSSDQYSSVYKLKSSCKAELLNMTCESAYTKAIVAVSSGFKGNALTDFMKKEINFEMID